MRPGLHLPLLMSRLRTRSPQGLSNRKRETGASLLKQAGRELAFSSSAQAGGSLLPCKDSPEEHHLPGCKAGFFLRQVPFSKAPDSRTINRRHLLAGFRQQLVPGAPPLPKGQTPWGSLKAFLLPSSSAFMSLQHLVYLHRPLGAAA